MPACPPDLIAKHGAVSEEVAKALAAGIRQRTGATIGLGITGVAGPGGGTEAKPVGRVYIAVSDAQKTDVLEHTFRGPRNRIRRVGSDAGAGLDPPQADVKPVWPFAGHTHNKLLAGSPEVWDDRPTFLFIQ